MTGLARLVAALIGLAVAACAFLPWVNERTAWALHVRSLFDVGNNEGVTPVRSVGAALCVAALLVLLGALFNARSLVIIGGLLAVALPSIWIFGNAVSHGAGAVSLTRIQIGAYGAAVGGFMALILAAVATDTSVPTTR
jgi:hypothetical protein